MMSNVTVAGLALGAILLSVPSALAQSDTLDRTVLPIPEPTVPLDHRARRAQREAAAALRGQGARGRAERADRADRRHGLRPVERLRRADPDADGRAAGQRRAALQRVPHDGALLADARRRCSPAATTT